MSLSVLHEVIIGTFSQTVVCAVSTIGKKREPTQFETIVKMVSSVFKIKEWLCGAGYLFKKCWAQETIYYLYFRDKSLCQEVNMQGMMDYGMTYGSYGSIMGIIILIFWILIIVGIVLLIKYLWEGGAPRGGTESALDVLRKRYARGEISKEEFEEKKKDLL